LTVELDDARGIVETEVALGRRLVQLGFMREYDERHVQVAAALASLGTVNHIRGVHRNTNPVARPVSQMLVESIIHDIHSVRWLSGSEITEIFTSAVTRERGVRMVILTCQLANGGVATLEFDDAATGYEVSIEVSADGGNVVAAEPLRAQVRADGVVAGKIGDDWFTPFLATYRVEMRDWLDSIEADTPRGPSAWDGYAAQAVVAAAVASESSGRSEVVELEPRPALYQRQGVSP
jgi:myo-inositol 2-dehydrogenase/D-chiro-inositol 1-dehydrogenase